jgi:hypothetical protein
MFWRESVEKRREEGRGIRCKDGERLWPHNADFPVEMNQVKEATSISHMCGQGRQSIVSF